MWSMNEFVFISYVWHDVITRCTSSSVLTSAGTKNYHGYDKQYHDNLFIRPDIGCGDNFCGENDASGVTAPKPLNENWFNNTCITAGSPYNGACSGPPNAASSDDMQYSGNTFLTPSGDATKLLVTCPGARRSTLSTLPTCRIFNQTHDLPFPNP